MTDPNFQAPQDPNLGQPQQPQQPPQPPQQPYQQGQPQQPYQQAQPGQPQQPYQQAPVAAAPLSQAEDIQWASFAHLGGIIGVLPSLIIWLVFKDRGRFTDTEAKEALNFQITMVMGYIVSSILAFLVIGIITYLAFGIISIIFSIMGFMKAKEGQNYRYPFSIRLIK